MIRCCNLQGIELDKIHDYVIMIMVMIMVMIHDYDYIFFATLTQDCTKNQFT